MALLSSASALAQSTATGPGQAYPGKSIRLIVPFPAGGGVDSVARITFQRLSELLGQQVVIDNRGGSGGVIAAEIAARAAPDGYTLFFGTTATQAITPHYRVMNRAAGMACWRRRIRRRRSSADSTANSTMSLPTRT